MNDDTQQLSPTTSDTVRHSPTESDDVRPRPTMSATRTEAHTLTTREVMKIFEVAGIPRAQRSIERYCQQGDLDCLPDAIERRQYTDFSVVLFRPNFMLASEEYPMKAHKNQRLLALPSPPNLPCGGTNQGTRHGVWYADAFAVT
jgi:hypothetical protein